MELYKFEGKPVRIEFDTPDLTIDDLINGPYILKMCDKHWPIYYVGLHDDSTQFLVDQGKTYFLTIVLINTLKLAAHIKNGTMILDDKAMSLRALQDLLKELYE